MSDEFSQSGMAGEVVTNTSVSDKSKVVAALLSFFLGGLGLHRIYLGHVGTGVFMMILFGIGCLTAGILIGFLFLGFVAIWDIIDFIRILFGGLKDKQGRSLK